MWGLLKRRGNAEPQERQAQVEAAPSPKRVTCGKGQLLYKYLSERYANRVVLTFSQIEDLLGFSLPDQARRQAVRQAQGHQGLDPGTDRPRRVLVARHLIRLSDNLPGHQRVSPQTIRGAHAYRARRLPMPARCRGSVAWPVSRSSL